MIKPTMDAVKHGGGILFGPGLNSIDQSYRVFFCLSSTYQFLTETVDILRRTNVCFYNVTIGNLCRITSPLSRDGLIMFHFIYEGPDLKY